MGKTVKGEGFGCLRPREIPVMKRNTLNLVVDVVTLAVLLGMVMTGIIIEWILPPGTGGRGGGASTALWDWTRHDWGDLHLYFGLTMLGLLVLHVALHWAWACNTLRRVVAGSRAREGAFSHRRRDLYGVAAAALIFGGLGGFWWVAKESVTVRIASHDGRRHAREGDRLAIQDGRHVAGGQGQEASERVAVVTQGRPQPAAYEHDPTLPEIRGSMTLAEAAAAIGVGVSELKAGLTLPADVGPDERLGRLRRQFEFEMEDVRKFAAEHRRQKH